METPPATSLLGQVARLVLAACTGDGRDNRLALEGVSLQPAEAGTLRVGVRKLEASSLEVTSGPLRLEVGQLLLHDVVADVAVGDGRSPLQSLEASGAGLSGIALRGPWPLPRRPGQAARGARRPAHAAAPELAPLAEAEGALHAEIVDAFLAFDVTMFVPLRRGHVDFNQATVEHVGPDSRLGASPQGLYVDAPNGRSYLYQFAAAGAAGVTFEHRGALFGPLITDRGGLHLQPFAEGLLRQERRAAARLGQQARLLLDRTAVSGDLRLGDGRLAVPGLRAQLTGRDQGHNQVHLRSGAVGRGLAVEIGSLAIRDMVADAGPWRATCAESSGSAKLRLQVDSGQLQFALEAPALTLTGLRLQPAP